MEKGDRVRYTGAYLRQIGAQACGEFPDGTVVKVIKAPPFHRVKVLWDGEDEPRTAKMEVLKRVGAPEYFE